jgi:hypothetical protein
MAPSLTRSVFAAAIALILASPASAEIRQLATKGMELYSYRNDGEWRFSLMGGTNRFKFCSEIRNPRGALTLEQLELALRRLAPREYLSWRGPDDAAFGRLSRQLELNHSDNALPRLDDTPPQ